jgi:hypothetical protein
LLDFKICLKTYRKKQKKYQKKKKEKPEIPPEPKETAKIRRKSTELEGPEENGKNEKPD